MRTESAPKAENSPDSVKKRKSVSLADEVVELGERLAKDENRTFSNYVETLILRDEKRAKETEDGKDAA